MEVETSKCRCWPPPRVGHISVMCDKFMIVWGGYNCDNDVQHEDYISPLHLWIYDTEIGLWFMKTVKRPVNLHEHYMAFDSPAPGVSAGCALCINKTLYIFGGHTLEGTSNDIYALEFNTLNNLQWERVVVTGKLPSPRDKCVGWEYKEKLYYFGGFTLPMVGNEYLNESGLYIGDETAWNYPKGWTNQLIAFDLATNRWLNPGIRGETICPRAAHSCAKLGDKVYIFGGRCLAQRLNDLYCIDLITLTATRLILTGDEPSGRSWQVFTPISTNHILLFGGFTTSQEVCDDGWVLDVQGGQWNKLQHLPKGHSLLWHTGCSNIQDDEVLIFGGLSNNILDSSEGHVFSEVLLKMRISPKSLKRLSIEATLHYQKELQAYWPYLPKQLYDILNVKVTHLNNCRGTETQSDEEAGDVVQNQNVTCGIS